MAFGESFGSILDRTTQVESKKTWPSGKLGETVFDTSDSPIAISILYIFDVSQVYLLEVLRGIDEIDATIENILSGYFTFLHEINTDVSKTCECIGWIFEG